MKELQLFHPRKYSHNYPERQIYLIYALSTKVNTDMGVTRQNFSERQERNMVRRLEGDWFNCYIDRLFNQNYKLRNTDPYRPMYGTMRM